CTTRSPSSRRAPDPARIFSNLHKGNLDMKKHMHYDEKDLAGILAFGASTGQAFNEDAGIIAARQLDYIKARVYERKLPPMAGLSLVPQESDAPEWAETITYRTFDQVGIAKIIANYADDLPRADVKGTEVTVP